jgi:aerobic carbon-monoxide dehydrogenase small subunit
MDNANLTQITFTINSKSVTLDVNPFKRLLDVLREDLKLTGTKEGCGEGECGACAVLVNGELVNSCLLPVIQVNAAEVQTIEDVPNDPLLSNLRNSFVNRGGVQCGFCTPGMILASAALLRKVRHPEEDEIREAVAGNLCRCTGYNKIVDAIREASGFEFPEDEL